MHCSNYWLLAFKWKYFITDHAPLKVFILSMLIQVSSFTKILLANGFSLAYLVIFYPSKILPLTVSGFLISSVGRYQYFTSGIRYYKFKTVFGIPWYFDQTQLTSYSWHFC